MASVNQHDTPETTIVAPQAVQCLLAVDNGAHLTVQLAAAPRLRLRQRH
jgi:hypothetical protein